MKNLILLLSIVTLAVGCGETSPDHQVMWQGVLSAILDVAVAILVPVLGVLAAWALKWLGRKFKVEFDQKHHIMVDELIAKGVAFAEEKGHQALKAGKPPLPGEEKKLMAVEFVTEQLESLGAVDWTAKKIENALEARLGVERPWVEMQREIDKATASE